MRSSLPASPEHAMAGKLFRQKGKTFTRLYLAGIFIFCGLVPLWLYT
jgi:hypothetical protein